MRTNNPKRFFLADLDLLIELYDEEGSQPLAFGEQGIIDMSDLTAQLSRWGFGRSVRSNGQRKRVIKVISAPMQEYFIGN